MAVERLEDLDALPHADGQALDLRVRVDVEAVLLGQLDDPLRAPSRGRRRRTDPDRLRAERHRLDHVEHGHEHEVLVDHPDAGVDGGGRVVEDALLAVDEDLARIRLVQARQDVHERRLAGAVLAEEAEDLATVGRDRDLVVGQDARELFGDVAQFEPHRAEPRLWMRDRPRSAWRAGGGRGDWSVLGSA